MYVDDILMISEDPKKTLKLIGEVYNIKAGSLGPPDTYLGAQIYKHNLRDGTWAWGMTSQERSRHG